MGHLTSSETFFFCLIPDLLFWLHLPLSGVYTPVLLFVLCFALSGAYTLEGPTPPLFSKWRATSLFFLSHALLPLLGLLLSPQSHLLLLSGALLSFCLLCLPFGIGVQACSPVELFQRLLGHCFSADLLLLGRLLFSLSSLCLFVLLFLFLSFSAP